MPPTTLRAHRRASILPRARRSLAYALTLTLLVAATPAVRADPAPRGRHSVEAALLLHQLTHPGFQLGYSLRAVETASGSHAFVVGADLGAYAWLRHDFGVSLVPRLSWRGRTASGFQGEVTLHVGYLQGVLASPTYAVVDGTVQEASRAGHPYLVVGPSAGVGWHFARHRVTPFVRVGAQWQYPVFDAALVRLMGFAGVEVTL